MIILQVGHRRYSCQQIGMHFLPNVEMQDGQPRLRQMVYCFHTVGIGKKEVDGNLLRLTNQVLILRVQHPTILALKYPIESNAFIMTGWEYSVNFGSIDESSSNTPGR